MARILRGDVVWADLDPVRGSEQVGLRPVAAVSEDVFNARSATVIAFAITSKQPNVSFPLVSEITSVQLPSRSWVKIGQIRTLSVERLGAKLGRLSSDEMDRVLEGLNNILGC
jgi:mRNA interferase MazF